MNWYFVYVAAAILGIGAVSAMPASAQDSNIPFHEVANVIVNATKTPSATVSITLQSTSINDMMIDPELVGRVAQDDRIAYIALTNEGACVPGVGDESCILVSILRSGEWSTIDDVQSGAKIIGDSYIDELNGAFDTSAEFHSVYIRYDSEARLSQASDRVIVSTVYTMPREDTASMFEKIGGIILSPDIRSGGGFYDVARYILAAHDARMLFSMTPNAGTPLMQMRIAAEFEIADPHSIDPIALFSADSIERSAMFSRGANPLGSIIQVAVISSDKLGLASSESEILPTRIIDGDHVPLQLNTPGWIFESASGKLIKAKYIFGTKDKIEGGDISFTLRAAEAAQMPAEPVPTFSVPAEILVIILAVIIGAGAAAWFLMRRA